MNWSWVIFVIKTPISGGDGETRTHTPISEPSVFKTVAAMPIRLTLPKSTINIGPYDQIKKLLRHATQRPGITKQR